VGAFSSPYAGPKEIRYLFIDGAQLERTLEELGRLWFDKPIELDYRKLQGNHTKVFYYDCLPAEKLGEAAADRQAQRDEKVRFFDKLRELPGWHVCRGLARHRKKEPQQQKEVDILIAVDMLTHTHRRNMHRLTFLSGDQDFAPLVEAVVREGMYVELLYPEGHTAPDLKNFADSAIPMTADFLYANATENFQRANGLPSVEFVADARVSETALAEGFVGQMLVAKAWLEDNSMTHNITAVPQTEQGTYLTVRHRDLERAKRMFALRHQAVIEWRLAEQIDRRTHP